MYILTIISINDIYIYIYSSIYFMLYIYIILVQQCYLSTWECKT